MQLFVGLGNPGREHARQRHNIGFMAVEAVAAEHGFGPWRRKFQGEVAEGRIGTEKVLLLKPQTYMNRSGQSVGEAVRFYKLAPGDVTVFHDELDLAPGRVRYKQGGGHAGHNGLRSIHERLGADYNRVRLGIGHPGDKSRVTGHVLHDFGREERAWVDEVLDAVARAADRLVARDGAGFSAEIARRTGPPPKAAGAARAGTPAADTPRDGGEAPGESGPFARLSQLLGRR